MYNWHPNIAKGKKKEKEEKREGERIFGFFTSLKIILWHLLLPLSKNVSLFEADFPLSLEPPTSPPSPPPKSSHAALINTELLCLEGPVYFLYPLGETLDRIRSQQNVPLDTSSLFLYMAYKSSESICRLLFLEIFIFSFLSLCVQKERVGPLLDVISFPLQIPFYWKKF